MHFTELAEHAVVGPPDWFLPGVLATTCWESTPSGGSTVIAFSSKPYIYIFLVRMDTGADQKLSYTATLIGQIPAHHDRISGLSLLISAVDWNVLSTVGNGAHPIQLFTCGQDGLVRHWMHADSAWMLAQELNVHAVHEALSPTALDTCFLPDSSALLVAIGCNKGMLIVWCITEVTQDQSYVCKKFESDEVLTCAWALSKDTADDLNFAVGYRKGLVGLYHYNLSSVTSGQSITQLSRFHAHEKDICDMFWHRYSMVDDSSKVKLITTARDQFVKAWDVENSYCSSSIRVPGNCRGSASSKETNRSTKEKISSVGNPWISACPVNSSSDIWISGLRGEIYRWCIRDPSLAPPKPFTSNVHSALIFAMRQIPNSDHLVVTASQDRQVIVWHATDQGPLTPVLRIPTLTGSVSALAQSEHGNGPLAVGVSDGSLLLWRPLMEPCFVGGGFGRDLTVLWPRGQNTNGISALAWHPSPRFESLLAYGTEAGCVDLLDTFKSRKVANIQKSKVQPYMFGTTVYRVVWGPPLFARDSNSEDALNLLDSETVLNQEADEKLTARQENNVCKDDIAVAEHAGEPSSAQGKFTFYVYSVCKGRIFCHLGFQRMPLDVSLRFPQPSNMNSEDWTTCKRTDICFLQLDRPRNLKDCAPGYDPISHNYDWIVCVGYRDGRVDVYAHRRSTDMRHLEPSGLSVVCTFSTHTKGINCFAWSYSHYRLAVGSNEHFITVMDLSPVLLESTKSTFINCITTSTCLARLEGHCNRITALDWSPHDPALLLSASFDGTANVWSIPIGDSRQNYRSVANFRAHRLRLFTCLWSRTESNLAYTGGELRHLLGWRPSKLVHTEPPNTRRYRPPPVKKALMTSLSNENGLSINVLNSIDSMLPVSNEVVTDELKASHSHETDSSITLSTSITKLSGAKKSTGKTYNEKVRKRPSLFPYFLRRDDLRTNAVDLTLLPPIRLSSKLAHILHVFRWLVEGIPLPSKELDLLFVLPESSLTRRQLFRFFNEQADYHLQLYRGAQKANGLMHLDAYCMLLLWMGRFSQTISTLIAERHMPFWLLWCIQLSKSTEPWPVTAEVFGTDLLGEKVKEIVSTSSDILVSATILVSSGRSREAVNLLLNHNRMKEALLLARLRLSPDEAWCFVEQCVENMLAHKIIGDVHHLSVIYQLGYGRWNKANALISRSSVSQSCKTIDKLASLWVQFTINSRDTDDTARLHVLLQLICSCLAVGFEFDVEAQKDHRDAYFNKWKSFFYNVSTYKPDDGLPVALSLLDTALLVSCMLDENGCTGVHVSAQPSAQTDHVLGILDKLGTGHIQALDWSTCLMHLVIDLTAVLNICNQSDSWPSEKELHRFTRVADTIKDCQTFNPMRTNRMIRHLKVFLEQLIPRSEQLRSTLNAIPDS